MRGKKYNSKQDVANLRLQLFVVSIVFVFAFVFVGGSL